MSTTAAIRTDEIDMNAVQEILFQGNIASLNPRQRIAYLSAICDALKINPLFRPIEFMTLNGKLVPYANKGCAEQLRSVHSITITITDKKIEGGVFIVTAKARMPSGREDEDAGAVSIEGLKGDALANAMLKATTKAKRRVTLSICGANMLDETEVDTIPNVIKNVTPETELSVPPTKWIPTEAQLKRLFAISKAAGWMTEELRIYMKNKYSIGSSSDLNRAQYDELCGYLEKNPRSDAQEPAWDSNVLK